MNQIERMFRDCEFHIVEPYEEDKTLMVQFRDYHLQMEGEIILRKNVEFRWFSKTENKTTIRKLNQFINVVLANLVRWVACKVPSYKNAIHQWLESTNWYQKEGGE